HFLYVARSGRIGHSSAYVGSLDGRSTHLFPTTSHVAYAPPGYLLYVQEGALLARPFDARTLAVGAETTTIVNRFGGDAGGMNGHFDVSANGVVAFFRNRTADKAVLRWFDRAGQPLAALTELGQYMNFRVAPNDDRVAVDLESERLGGRDVWVLNPNGA